MHRHIQALRHIQPAVRLIQLERLLILLEVHPILLAILEVTHHTTNKEVTRIIHHKKRRKRIVL